MRVAASGLGAGRGGISWPEASVQKVMRTGTVIPATMRRRMPGTLTFPSRHAPPAA